MTGLPPDTVRLRLPASAFDVLRYAAASGDFHALHHDRASSEARAFAGPVLPGRYQHGAIARLLQEALHAELCELECSYLAPAHVDQELWLEVRVRLDAASDTLRVRMKLVGANGGLVLAGRACLSRLERAPGAPARPSQR